MGSQFVPYKYLPPYEALTVSLPRNGIITFGNNRESFVYQKLY